MTNTMYENNVEDYRDGFCGRDKFMYRFYKTRVKDIGLSQGRKDIPTNYDHGILKVMWLFLKFLITIKLFYGKIYRVKYFFSSYFTLRLWHTIIYYIL